MFPAPLLHFASVSQQSAIFSFNSCFQSACAFFLVHLLPERPSILKVVVRWQLLSTPYPAVFICLPYCTLCFPICYLRLKFLISSFRQFPQSLLVYRWLLEWWSELIHSIIRLHKNSYITNTTPRASHVHKGQDWGVVACFPMVALRMDVLMLVNGVLNYHFVHSTEA